MGDIAKRGGVRVKAGARPADRAGMNEQLRLHVILPVVVLAAVAAAGLFLLSRGGGSSSTSELTPISLPRKAAPTPAASQRPARTKGVKPVQPARAAKPAKPAKPVVRLKPGLPPELARALRAAPVAVVSFVTPDASLDTMAAKEAQAGARAAGAAFVKVDVTSERAAKPFALAHGVVDAPNVLVFKRPGDLFVQLDGFADLDTVAQAVDNARL
jgi:hypothetical protein